MANKMSIISEIDMDTIEIMMPNLTDEQRTAIVNFGAQMYHDGLSEWGPWFFFGGLYLGVALIAVPLVRDKLKKQKESDDE